MRQPDHERVVPRWRLILAVALLAVGRRAVLAVVAAEAAAGLADGHRLGPGQLDFVEVVAPPFDGDQVQFFAGRVGGIGVRIEGRIHLLGFAPEGVLGAGQVEVDAHRGALAGRHGLDHRGRPADGVAAGENPFLRGLPGDRIDVDERRRCGFPG